MLKGRIAIITGAAGGIGKVIAKTLVEQGTSACLVDIDEDRLRAVKEELESQGGKIHTIACNLMEEESPKKIVESCVKTFGGLDYLINNAGYAARTPFMEITRKEYLDHILLNAYTPLAMTQQAVPYLKQSEVPTIVNISSITSINPYECQGSYVSSKHALRGITKVMAMELFDEDPNIRVHTIAPTGVDTEMIAITRPDLDSNMFCKREEIAEIILFLLTHRNNSIIDEIVLRRHTKKPWEL